LLLQMSVCLREYETIHDGRIELTQSRSSRLPICLVPVRECISYHFVKAHNNALGMHWAAFAIIAC
jgi:hypothetical protein